MAIDYNDILPNPDEGWAAIISWLAQVTDGTFWIWFLAVLFLIIFIPGVVKWGIDWPLLGTSTGVFILSFIIWLADGLGEVAFFGFILIWIISIVKFTIFPEY